MKLYGKNPVIERLKTNPASIKRIYLQENQPDASYIRTKASRWDIPVFFVNRSKMLKMGRNLNTQGILIEIDDYAYSDYTELLERSISKRHSLLFLDGLNDPQNLGVIVRSLACLGGFSIVLPTHGSVEVTEAVLRVASGGDNYISIAQVPNLSGAISRAKEAGYWIAGAVVGGGVDLAQATLPFPLSLVIGSEHSGIREVIRRQLDLELTIPMAFPRLSLNAAQATTIFCYEISRQRKTKKPV